MYSNYNLDGMTACTRYNNVYVLFRRPNSFVIITANRVIHCNTDTPEEMHHWIGLLQKSKGDSRVDGQEFIVRGTHSLRGCSCTCMKIADVILHRKNKRVEYFGEILKMMNT